jgi:predicted lipoprotein with Yx(FWY)xxD motif
MEETDRSQDGSEDQIRPPTKGASVTRIRSVLFLVGAAGVLLATLVLVGCGSGPSATAQAAPPKAKSAPPAIVSVANDGKLGQILVDSQGRTLYMFSKDSGTTSACTGACASFWPPLRSSGDPVVHGGANAFLVGTITRSDGTPEATYNGHPLYTFVKDRKPGDTNGEGLKAFGSTWFVVSPAGEPVRPPAPPKPKPQPAPNPIPQGNGGDHDSDNNGGPDDGDGDI